MTSEDEEIINKIVKTDINYKKNNEFTKMPLFLLLVITFYFLLKFNYLNLLSLLIVFVFFFIFNVFYIRSNYIKIINKILGFIFIVFYIYFAILPIFNGFTYCIFGCKTEYGITAFLLGNLSILCYIFFIGPLSALIIFVINKCIEKYRSKNNKIILVEQYGNQKKINKKSIFIPFIRIFIIIIFNSISFYIITQNIPFVEYLYEGYVFSLNGFTFYEINKDEVGQAGEEGYYFYNPITKKFIKTFVRETAPNSLYYYSGREYNVLMLDKNFFMYDNNGRVKLLVNENILKNKTSIPLKGLFKSQYRDDEIYIINNNTYLYYNAENKSTYLKNYETYDYGDSKYFININDGIIYDKKKDVFLGYKKASENAPSYYNINNLSKYNNIKSSMEATFKSVDGTTNYNEIYIKGNKAYLNYNPKIFSNAKKEIENIEFYYWDSNYIYFGIPIFNTILKYDVNINKFEIEGYELVSKEELEFLN